MIKVDKIVTISLQENEQRRQQTEVELEKLQLKTTFFLAKRDTGYEERGCFYSHVEVCKQALRENCQTLLVFEDDVKILAYTPKQIAALNQFITQTKTPFDIVYLGLIIGKMWFCGHAGIVRTKGAGAHAYLLSRAGIEKMAAYEYKGIPIDKLMKNELKCYSLYPIIAEQYPETSVPSDITPNRRNGPMKDEAFWRDNFQKQWFLPWKDFLKSIKEIFITR